MRGTQESEDCLYLNIFVPADIKTNEKLAVMFFIHGEDCLYTLHLLILKKVKS